ncbi:hypothetical protein N480_01080 [Pseudoalteromonas luteoviolacea S2607]|uniref:hypothetical protein n=1 Tax=Pseudoalteromonas luteoviolacea TaxID=43657 RepID=UPI0007B05618|nr:hypothetical protein [Pseudoalteromonas luteoviolacea]KZN39455.1 hypothetical protein N480_01080 [Pseudoalteromonas luteoviolacea S2607]
MMSKELVEIRARQNKYFSLISSVFFLLMGIVVLTGMFVPYTPLPNETTLSYRAGNLFLNKQENGVVFVSSGGESSPLCDKAWIDIEELSAHLMKEADTRVEVKINLNDPSISDTYCLTIFGLKINDKQIISIEDVKSAKNDTKLIFNLIAIVFIIAGLFKFYDFKKSLSFYR